MHVVHFILRIHTTMVTAVDTVSWQLEPTHACCALICRKLTVLVMAVVVW